MTSVCLVLGSAKCLWKDIEAFKALGTYDAVIAVKQAGVYWPGPLRAWVTLHPVQTEYHIKERRAAGYPDADEVVAHIKKGSTCVDREFDYLWPGMPRSGASGIAGAKYAIHDLGFDRAVLCGIPMVAQSRIDNGGHWTDEKTENYRNGVRPVVDDMKRFVRSMSGWTREVLGAPTAEWLAGRGD